MKHAVLAAALDVEGAISASASGGLGRGLVLASLLVVLVASVRQLSKSLRRSHATSGSRSSSAEVLDAGVVVASASAVGLVGSVVGLVATFTNQSILVGNGIASFFTTGLGLASLVGAAVFIVVIILRKKISSAPGKVLSLLGVVVCASLMSGLVVSGDLPRPASSANAKTTLNDSVSATAVVVPGAAGTNSVRVGLSGPDEEIKVIREAVEAGLATATLVSLELDAKSEPVTLTLDDQGALFVEEIVAEAPGRWRVQIDLGDNGDLLMLDVTLVANPGYNK
jgi:hypothetical protein